jgi:hypothetical protein
MDVQRIDMDCYRWVNSRTWEKRPHEEQALWVAHMMDLMVKTHGDRVCLSLAYEGMARRIHRIIAVDKGAGGATWPNTANMDLPVRSGPSLDSDLASEAITAHTKEQPRQAAAAASAGNKSAAKAKKSKPRSGGGGGAARPAAPTQKKKKSTKGGTAKGKGAGAPPGGAAAEADEE